MMSYCSYLLFCINLFSIFQINYSITYNRINYLKCDNSSIEQEPPILHHNENFCTILLKCKNNSTKFYLVNTFDLVAKEPLRDTIIENVFFNDKFNQIFLIYNHGSTLTIVDHSTSYYDVITYRRSLKFKAKRLLFSEQNADLIISSDQHDLLWISHDNGTNWSHLDENVNDTMQIYSHNHEEYVVYTKNGGQLMVYSLLAKTVPSEAVLDNVVEFSVVDGFLFAVRLVKGTQYLYMARNINEQPEVVSIEGNTLDMSSLEYKVLRVSNDQVFLIVFDEKKNSSNLYISNVNGLEFKLSLKNIVYCSKRRCSTDFAEFYSIPSIEGVHLANVEKSTIRTVITFDNGNTWDNLNFGDSTKQMTMLPNILSKSTLPGFIVAAASSSAVASQDFGKTWYIIQNDFHTFQFSKSGTFLLAAKKNVPIKEISYSTNYGKEFKVLFPFTDDDPIVVKNIFTTDDETEFILIGISPNHGGTRVVQIYLKTLFSKTCLEKDYEEYRPLNRTCHFGEEIVYKRRLEGSLCFGDAEEALVKREYCLCSRDDYECDVGYENKDGKCKRSSREDALKQDCDTNRYFYRSMGYKKRENTKCIGTNADYEPQLIDCKSNSGQVSVFSTKNSLMQYNYEMHKPLEMLKFNDERKEALVFDYDTTNDTILFWYDVPTRAINSKLNQTRGVNENNVVVSNLEHDILDLRVDWINKNIYWIDVSSNSIEIANYAGTARRTIRKVTNVVRALLLDPIKSFMYWIEEESWANRSRLVRAWLDGTHSTDWNTINETNLTNLIIHSETLYWMSNDEIMSLDIQRENRTVTSFFKLQEPTIFFALNRERIYTVNPHDDKYEFRSIIRSNKKDTFQFSNENDVNSFRLFSIDRQLYGENNICLYANNCSHICISRPSNVGGYTCMCPSSWPSSQHCTDSYVTRKECKLGEFRCKSGVCVSRGSVCNGKRECNDGSDEFNCDPLNSCYRGFRCLNGTCLNSSLVCNNVNDCFDQDLTGTGQSSDESCSVVVTTRPAITTTTTTRGITTTVISTTQSSSTTTRSDTCDQNTSFECDSTDGVRKCLDRNKLCNGNTDCRDGVDEINCEKCTEGAILCNTTCLHPSNEQNCANTAPTTTSLKTIILATLFALMLFSIILLIAYFYIKTNKKRSKMVLNYQLLDNLSSSTTLAQNQSTVNSLLQMTENENETLLF